MRCGLVMIIGAGLCIGLLPACNPLLRQAPANDLAIVPTASREALANRAPAGAAVLSNQTPSANGSVKPAAALGSALKEPMIERVPYPAVSGQEIVPPVAEPSPVAKLMQPQQDPEVGVHAQTKAKPAEDAPLLEAVRYFLNKQPTEAVAWLSRYDKPSQELLLCLLPLAVRLSEEGWDQHDPREATIVVEQLDRMMEYADALVRRRAQLSIKKMCFCSREIELTRYGNYQPIPDSHVFQPGEWAQVYVELQNLLDEPQGNAYSIHLTSRVEIRDFNGRVYKNLDLPDRGPELSASRRHDFYHSYSFRVPLKLAPGFYTLWLKITDVSTGRTATGTLDFRVVPPYGNGTR